MKTQVAPIIYIIKVPRILLDKIRQESNSWAEGNENLCLTYEAAAGIEEIKEFLPHLPGSNVILSR